MVVWGGDHSYVELNTVMILCQKRVGIIIQSLCFPYFHFHLTIYIDVNFTKSITANFFFVGDAFVEITRRLSQM